MLIYMLDLLDGGGGAKAPKAPPPLNPPLDELGCCERVSSSYSTSGTRHVTLVTNLASHELGNSLIVVTTNGTYLWSFMTQILMTST